MLALWSCGRRAGVVQAQRPFTIAETVVCTIADEPALAIPRGHTSIGRHGSEHHSVRGFSSPLLQPTLQCSQLTVGVAAGALSLQPFQQLARCMPRLCLKPSAQLGRHCREWIGPTPQSLGLCLCYDGRADLTLFPCCAQTREKLLQCR